jgi:hypothetical protein
MVMENLDSSRPVRRLGFKEIVPGVADSDQTQGPDVPKYDLGQRIMANQRRVVAATRKRPGQQEGSLPPSPAIEETASVTDALQRPAPPAIQRSKASERIWHPVMTEAQHRVIARIVARDIERLCRGERVFGS